MVRDWIFLPKEQDKTRMSMFISSSQHWAIRQGEQITGIQSRMKEVKQSLFTEDMSVYVKKHDRMCSTATGTRRWICKSCRIQDQHTKDSYISFTSSKLLKVEIFKCITTVSKILND